MNQYIERYVYDVTRRLDNNIKDDVAQELITNIYDMLPNEPTESEIEEVLYTLGHPKIMAAKFTTSEKCLISPKVYDQYINILKLAVVGLGLLLFITNFIQYLIATQSLSIQEMLTTVLGKSITGFIEGAIAALFIVTICFIVIDRNYEKIYNEKWKISNLPKLVDEKAKPLSKGNVIFGLVFSTFISGIFIFLLLNHNSYLGWYTLKNSQLEFVTPLYNNHVLVFVPVFIVALIVNWCVKTFILTQNSLNLKVEIAQAIERIITGVVLIVFVYSKDIINPDFFTDVNQFVNSTEFNAANLYIIITNLIAIIALIIMILAIAKIIVSFLRRKDQVYN